MSEELTGAQIHVLHHALGIDAEQRKPYRRHFMTGEGTTDYPVCMSLVELGLMVRRESGLLAKGDYYFIVTEEGERKGVELLPPAPKLTRSQKRYRRFLDADMGISFREFLQLEQEGK